MNEVNGKEFSSLVTAIKCVIMAGEPTSVVMREFKELTEKDKSDLREYFKAEGYIISG